MADEDQVIRDDAKILQFNDHGKVKNTSSTTTNLVVIELDDVEDITDELHVDDDDEDCVFVSDKILFSEGNHKQFPICLDGYLQEERELLRTPKKSDKKRTSVQCVDDYDDDDDNDEIRVLTVRPSLFSNSTKRRKPFTYPSITEVGESSGSKSTVNVEIEVIEIPPDRPEVMIMFLCEICFDSKPQKDSFKIKGCSHSYCFDCMKNYVASKLQDGVSQIDCPVPSCPGLLEPEYCREILPFEVFDRWGKLLCESVILASQKFYCPFKDCSALLIDDADGGELITQSECPSCFRLFCAQCKVGWLEGIECGEYQKLNKDERDKEDIMLRNLAKGNQWQRCPKCKFYVERTYGCRFMLCRCGIGFCYTCGGSYAGDTPHLLCSCI